MFPCDAHEAHYDFLQLANGSLGKGKVKIKFTLEESMKAQRGSRGTALIFI
jgi:hypothetical protein